VGVALTGAGLGWQRELAVFLELAKFASLLLSILTLDAVFHTAFLEPGSHLEQQLLPALRMLLLAAAVSLVSGYIFREGEKRSEQGAVRQDGSVAGSLPMMIFWWGSGVMALLFGLAWLVERYDHLWR
jgi:hypothetical protein